MAQENVNNLISSLLVKALLNKYQISPEEYANKFSAEDKEAYSQMVDALQLQIEQIVNNNQSNKNKQ